MALKGLNNRNESKQIAINAQFSNTKNGASPYLKKKKLPQTLLEHIRNDSISPSGVVNQKRDIKFNSMVQNINGDLNHDMNPSKQSNTPKLSKSGRANTVMSAARSKCASFLGPEEHAKLKKSRDYDRFLRDHQMIESILQSQRSRDENHELLQKLDPALIESFRRVFPRDMAVSTGRKKDSFMLDFECKVAKISLRNQPLHISRRDENIDMNITEIQEYLDLSKTNTTRLQDQP